MTPSVDELADAVESRLGAQGLQLTMGGEPTFIPEEPDAPEWNQEALGPQKLGYARRLAARLLRELYPGGVVMQVFGKQYPGEPLPRWVVRILDRDDGVPLWTRPALLHLDDKPGSNTDREARKVIGAVAVELGLGRFVLPCVERAEASDRPKGWVLPLDRTETGWASDAWPFSSHDPVVLSPGGGPLGLRLPLEDLDEQHLHRALTVEAAGGALHVFIPPLDIEAFSVLLRVIERVAVRADVRGLVLCGYQPSGDPPLSSLGLAADPGVLEVNLPPCRTWRDYDGLLERITHAARAEGLCTTRLHFNGQVQGTGGGAHVLFGGPSIEDNPFFARPDLLSSIIRYWQWHPALSYFFSGQYVGPGSQAPRADETLSGRLYELETACDGVDSIEGAVDRDFLDHLFRNFLTDSAGNTHRAEICMDKLWRHGSPGGQQGLIELRAFETMPEPGVQSLVALLLRSILAMLASEPRTGALLRFGPALHDRYMLPAALWEDLGQVCQDLTDAGLPFDLRWLEPVLDARFPVLGRLPLNSGELVVRQALDPWPLMAEDTDAGRTSRVVDNSTDRVEISLSDASFIERGQVAVNGVGLRFRDVGGRLVAGVRYKSASGWPAVHPHIPIQSPLYIEVLDQAGEVISAGRYYYWNPDQPQYADRPRDLSEALQRQRARWRVAPIAPRIERQTVEPRYTEESYFTLDLRRQGAV
ncbi:MAG: transglutaminase family protein [Polyangiales bacterium]